MTQKNTPSKDRASYRVYRVERSRGPLGKCMYLTMNYMFRNGKIEVMHKKMDIYIKYSIRIRIIK